jgi:hypothetical protein
MEVSKFIAENRKVKMSFSTSPNILIKTIFLAVSLDFSAQAEPLPSKEQPKQWAHDFTLGLESFKYHYGEKDKKGTDFIQLNGVMCGLNGSYQLTYRDRVFIRPEARVVYGHTDYNGFYGNDPSRMNKIPSAIIEPRLLIGSPLKTTEKLTLSPYVGLGFRYKWDDSSDIIGTEGAPGLKRINKTWYVPLGSRFQYLINEQWSVQGFAEYDWFLSGRQSTYKKNVVPYPIINKQKNGWGAKAELLLGRQFEEYLVAFGPYIHYWHIKKSNDVSGSRLIKNPFTGITRKRPVRGVYEPDNITKEIGMKVNITF